MYDFATLDSSKVLSEALILPQGALISLHFLHVLFAVYLFAIMSCTFDNASNTYRDIHNKKIYTYSYFCKGTTFLNEARGVAHRQIDNSKSFQHYMQS